MFISIVLYMYMYVYKLFTYKQYNNINTCKIKGYNGIVVE